MSQGYHYIGSFDYSLSYVANDMVYQEYSADSDITNYYYDQGNEVLGLYGAAFGQGVRPCNYLIDRDGDVRVAYGSVISHEDQWRAWIEELL